MRLDYPDKKNYLIIMISMPVIFFIYNMIVREYSPRLTSDNLYYYSMAEGNFENVVMPFSSRVLHPFVVHFISKLFHISLTNAFKFVSEITLFVFLIGLGIIFVKLNQKYAYWWIFVILINPLIIDIFKEFYMPDLFFMGFQCLFFAFLVLDDAKNKSKTRLVILTIILILMMLIREITLIFICFIIITGWLFNEKKLIYIAIIGGIIGYILRNQFIHLGQTNVHAMNEFVYLILKFPFNFLKNILGFQLWTNTFEEINTVYCSPLFTFDVSNISVLGKIKQIGLCNFEPKLPINTFLYLLTSFGVLPAFVIGGFKKVNVIKDLHPVIFLSLVYGMLSYLIGPLSGTSVTRLLSYGWPAFFIGAMFLMEAFNTYHNFGIGRLTIIQLAINWLPDVVKPTLINYAIALVIVVICYILIIRRFGKLNLSQSLL